MRSTVRRTLIVVLVSFQLGSCMNDPNWSIEMSNPTIFLYADFIPDREARRILRTLNLEGFQATLNHLQLPEGLVTTTIVYSPLVGAEIIKEIEGILNRIGYDDVESVFSYFGYHSYSKNNLGIYFLPD